MAPSVLRLFSLVAGSLLANVVVQADSEWHMQPVTTIHTRFVGDQPVFDKDSGTWSAGYPLSSVNTASLAGALQYAQAEILPQQYINNCYRRYNATWIVFYEFQIANPSAMIAYYQNVNPDFEYGQYSAFDGGMCTDNQHWCPQLWNGSYAGQPLPIGDWNMDSEVPANSRLGPYVGGNPYGMGDMRAPYPDNHWFSLPGECSLMKWADKTDECVEDYPSGRCPGEFGTNDGKSGLRGIPDGVECTWNYRVLGAVDVNGLVGMYDVIDTATGKPYDSSDPIGAFHRFCRDTNNEYKGIFYATKLQPNNTYSQTGGFSFFHDPSVPAANEERTTQLLEYYADTKANPDNIPIPSPEELRSKNPKCYENAPQCGKSSPCWRDSQMICQHCTGSTPAGLCETVPSDFPGIPPLTYPPPPEAPTTTTTATTATTSTDTTDSPSTTTTVDFHTTTTTLTTTDPGAASEVPLATLLATGLATVAAALLTLV